MSKLKFKYTGTFSVSGYKLLAKTVTHYCECQSFYDAFILLSAFAINQQDNYELLSITDDAGNEVLIKPSHKINPVLKPIRFNCIEYAAIKKFDCHTISLIEEHGSGYSVVIPISPKEYRRKNPTKAKVKITEAIDGYTTFWCYDDLGNAYVLDIPNHLQNQIAFAKQAAINNELLEN